MPSHTRSAKAKATFPEGRPRPLPNKSTVTDTEIIWRPSRRQEDFISLPDTIKEGGYGGAAGGGKSEVLLFMPLIRGFHQEPRFKGILFRRTYPELESEIIRRSEYYYPSTGAKYHQEKKFWKWPSGAIMSFGHMEYEKDVRKYDSAEYNLIEFDEATSFTEFMYLYMFSRSRTSSNLPAIVRNATNPGNIGHGWYRKRFIEPGPSGVIFRDPLSGLKRIFIQSLVTDNPHIDPEYINTLKLLPEAERRAKLDGDWWTFEGQVFGDFRTEHFPGEPDNAIHVIDHFTPPDWWPRFLSVDWGYSAKLSAHFAALSPDDRLFVYREYTVQRTNISVWATELGKICSDEGIDKSNLVAIMCKSAWQQRGDDLTIVEQAEKYSGIRFEQPDNDRIAGKLMFQEYLRWKPLPNVKRITGEYDHIRAATILRKSGQQAYEEYLASFMPDEPELNLPKIQITRACPDLIRVIPLCVADKEHKEDVAEFEGDDHYDSARYLIMKANQYLGKLKIESRKRSIVAKVIDSFGKIDMTSFYRKMEHVERASKGSSDQVAVKRFHGRVA